MCPEIHFLSGKNFTFQCQNMGLIPGWEDPQETKVATHSSILAWEIPRTEEPGRLQSTELQRVGHN